MAHDGGAGAGVCRDIIRCCTALLFNTKMNEMTNLQWQRFIEWCQTGKYPEVPTYRANYIVEAEPMSLKEYCERTGFYDQGQRTFDTKQGYYFRIKFPFEEVRVGWMTKEMFDRCFTQILT